MVRTVCDYVHLNPVRAGMLGKEDRLLSYPWSSLMWYLAAAKHRPRWIRVDRLLGEHGIVADTAEGRRDFEARMEVRRRQETDEADNGNEEERHGTAPAIQGQTTETLRER